MKLTLALLVFHRKLIVPSLIISMLMALLGMGITGSFSLKMVGVCYWFLAFAFQYLIYELNNPNEYYFYYNLGLSKPILYASTFVIGLLIVLLSAIL